MIETRIERLRPIEIRKRREELSVAYLPLGPLEWHGLHNPLGADGLQAEEIARRCAMHGGVVFPTVYYGESRVNSLLETDLKYKKGISEYFGIMESCFEEERFPYSGMEQIEHYQHHLIHIISEVASYGYELVVLIAGHYPLIEHARSAVVTYNQWAYDKSWKRISCIATSDFVILKGIYENAGDHAGGWETSHLLASAPDTVDMELAVKEKQFGIMSKRDPQYASAEFGNEIYEAAVKKILDKVENWKKHPEEYLCHGMCLD